MKKIYIKEEYCLGCRLCEIYCHVKHSNSKKIIKAYKKGFKNVLSRILVEEIGYNSFAIQCRHCEDAPCVEACISGAMKKNKNTGVVTCDEDKCVGCWSCIMVCPYGVIKQNTDDKKIASKCDLCEDEAIPVCVRNCPNEALRFTEKESSGKDKENLIPASGGRQAAGGDNMNKKTLEAIDYIIIGNSAAGLAGAESIREIDKTGSIAIFTEENFPNYSKPLITYYLAGKIGPDDIFFKREDFYRCNSLTLNLESRVEAIDFKNSIISIENGKKYGFKKLLLANGGKPIIPEIKISEADSIMVRKNEKEKVDNLLNGKNYRNFEGIYSLTTIEDAITIRNYLRENDINGISILGGGLIGLKSAEAFLELGMHVNIIELAGRMLVSTFDSNASGIVESVIREKGSYIFKNDTIENIYVKNGKMSGCRLKSGKLVESNLLILAIGVLPDTGLIKNSGIKINRGIVVDDYMKTSLDNVYAAGDVAECRDILLGENRNIAIWPLASRQGSIAGTNMAGSRKEYGCGFFMNSVEILGLPSISMGLSGLDETEDKKIEVLKEYRPEDKFYKKIVIKDNRIVGLIMIGNIDRAGIYAGLIKNRIDISAVKKNIAEENFGIIKLPADYKKHLVTGEGIEV